MADCPHVRCEVYLTSQIGMSARDCWLQVGGGTAAYDRDRYRKLLIGHGHLVLLRPGEKPEPLPCGWPESRTEPERHDYVSTACQHNVHDKCRLTCKFCPARCRCACHVDRDGDRS